MPLVGTRPARWAFSRVLGGFLADAPKLPPPFHRGLEYLLVPTSRLLRPFASVFFQLRFSGQPAHHHGHERAPKSSQFLSVPSVTNNSALGLVNRALQPVQLGARSVVAAEAGLTNVALRQWLTNH